CDPGCRVYLSYLNEAPLLLGDQDNGPFTIVVDGQAKITFKELNQKRLPNGEKGYLDIPVGTTEFIIHNPNGNGVARPLALLVIPNNTPSLDTVQFYEATDGAKIVTSSSRVVLMNVAPFTANAKIDGTYSLVVKTSPFDTLSNDKCEYVFKSTSPSFSLPFNSPVVSFGFDSKQFTMTLNTDLSYPNERSIDATGYFAAPGYIGCGNRSMVFNSESYNFGITSFNETFLIDGEKRRHVSFYGDINTDDTAPILLYDMDTDDEPLRIVGSETAHTSLWQYEMDTSSFSIHWDSLCWRNESYM
ncbi:hypothetical protein PENTCL1PPCAC_21388, partial [Pristionchus entomophagus]